MDKATSQKRRAEEALDNVLPSKRAKDEEPSPVVESTVKITDLPNEALIHIINYLPYKDLFNVEGVNKQMRAAALATWPKKTELSLDPVNYNKFNDEAVKRLFDRMPNLLVCNFSNFCKYYASAVTPDVTSLFSMVPKLTELNLSYLELKNENIVDISKFCPLLTKLTLGRCEDEIEDGMIMLFQNCSLLKHFSLLRAKSFIGDCFENAPLGLVYLCFEWCSDITSTNLIRLGQRCINLEAFRIVTWRHSDYINSWMPYFKHLKAFALHTRDDYWKSNLDFSLLPELETLVVIGEDAICQRLTCLTNCKKLKALELEDVLLPPDNLDNLKNLSSLKYFNIVRNKLRDYYIDFINHMNLEFFGFTKLWGLHYPREEVYAEAVEKFMFECPSLRYLEVEYFSILVEVFQRHREIPRTPQLEVAVVDWPKDVPHITCSWVNLVCCHEEYYYDFTKIPK